MCNYSGTWDILYSFYAESAKITAMKRNCDSLPCFTDDPKVLTHLQPSFPHPCQILYFQYCSLLTHAQCENSPCYSTSWEKSKQTKVKAHVSKVANQPRMSLQKRILLKAVSILRIFPFPHFRQYLLVTHWVSNTSPGQILSLY